MQGTIEAKEDCRERDMEEFEQNLFTSPKGGENQIFYDEEVDSADKYYVNAKINWQNQEILGKIFTIENQHT